MNNLIGKNMEKAIKLIECKENIFIVSHVNPDGDNIGSMLALASALKKVDKKATVLKADFTPNDFKFLTGYDDIIEYTEDLGAIDLLIAVDSSDEDRLGKNKVLVDMSESIINIDHHISNTMFGDVNIVDPKAAATGELIYDLIKRLGIEMDPEIGESIYTAISTDTGKFSYESVTSRTHKIIAELIDSGTDTYNINVKIHENISMQKINLFLETLKTLKTYEDNKIATVCITQDMLNRTNTTIEDSEGIISFIRKLDTVEVACLLKEMDEEDIKISLRSKNYVDVSSICEFFNGGGHTRAAGCSVNSKIDEARDMIVEKIIEFIR
ncbi:MAG TPA: bifunctional oligoribonuclease/PAP phosphatase NrnA [Tissierellaceae bacterium]|nr:bifunctional oligoribonuclease/PAP phosphatase NrnA [Tissierellaceae bacterium]